MKSNKLIAAIAAGSLLLAACGGDDDSDTGADTADTGADTADTGADTADTADTAADTGEATTEETGEETAEDTASEAAPDADIDPDAVLRVGWSLGPRNMDPHTANTIGDYPFLSLVYDRLINLAPDEQLEPMLATSWEFVDGGAALEMELREGISFHDGTAFDAEAVKANIERAKTLENGTLAGSLAPVADVEVLGPHSVRFNLAPGTGASLPYTFAERPGMMISPAAMDDPTLDQYGVGTGPYAVKEGTFSAADRATFVRAPGEYWDAPNRQSFAEIEMIAMPDLDTRVNALQSGQIDLAPLASVKTPQAIELGETDEFDNALYSARSYFHVSFNLSVPEFQDARVREAIAHAIDKEALNDAVFEGVCTTTSQMPLETDPFYVPELEGLYEYDPDAAKSLLADAGLETLDLTGVLITTEPQRSMTIAIQAMLAEVGINWDISETLSSQEGLPRWTAGEFDLHSYIAAGRADPIGMYVEAKDRNLPGGLPAGAEEALASAEDPSLSEADRVAALSEVNRSFVENFAQIYICHPTESLLGRSNIIGLDQSPWMRFGVFDVQNLAMAAS